jgi:hypothetical protein
MSILVKLIVSINKLIDQIVNINHLSKETQKSLLYILVVSLVLLLVMIIQTILIKWAIN